jgi:hypothetical protein
MQKRIIFPYVVIIIMLWWWTMNKYNNIWLNTQQLLLNTVTFSGNTFSWTTCQASWSVNIDKPSDSDLPNKELLKYKSFQTNWFARTFSPPKQPILSKNLSYSERSNQLNAYLSENNFYFRVTNKLNDGYLYISLDKPIGDKDIFLYWHNTNMGGFPVSWKLNKSKNLIYWNNQEFLYKLSDIQIYRFYNSKPFSFNWLNQYLTNTEKLNFIWWYTTTSDGNFIKEITVVWI